MELKRMMEKLGQAKTHLELKKMIAEVDTTNSGVFIVNSMSIIWKIMEIEEGVIRRGR